MGIEMNDTAKVLLGGKIFCVGRFLFCGSRAMLVESNICTSMAVWKNRMTRVRKGRQG